MNLHLAEELRDLTAAQTDALLLGIILGDGTVRLRVADADNVPAHRDWVDVDGIAAVRGFSLLIKRGQVHAFFRMSELNSAHDYLLELEHVAGLLARLPSRPNPDVYGE